MRIIAAIIAGSVMLGGVAIAQEKPVPKDSARVMVPGCSKGIVFTAGPRTEDQVGRTGIPEGMRFRMNGPKAVMTQIKAHEGQTIQITGLIKKGQYDGTGINVGGGVRITPGTGGVSVGRPSPDAGINYIDVESWQPAPGSCPTR